MSPTATTALALAAAWVAGARGPSGRDVRARIARPQAEDARRPAAGASSRRPGPQRTAGALRVVGALGAATVALLLVGTAFGVVVALGVGAVAWLLLGRFEPAAVRRRRRDVERDLPFAADLLAAALAAGAAPHRALQVVGEAVGGVVGDAFARSAAVLAFGAPIGEAVAPWRADPSLGALEPVARTMIRASTSGSALAASTAQLAADVRAARRWRVDEVARRVGVRSAAPLGVCFLPAFVLLGIVPVVISGVRAVGL